MSSLRTLRKDGVTHVALESRSGYVLLCRQDSVPGEIGIFGWSDEWSFLLAPNTCRRCAHLLVAEARAEREAPASTKLRVVPGKPG